MEILNFFAQDAQGNIMPSAECYLYAPGTTNLVSGLVDINGMPISNPFQASSIGQVQFGAPNGVYDLRMKKGARDTTIRIQCADLLQALNETASFLGARATAPTTRADGTPLQLADRYLNTTDQIEYIYKSSGWVANNLDGQMLATTQGASLVGALMQDGSAVTVQQAINQGDVKFKDAVKKNLPTARWYGAVGDGVTNDTSSFSALEAVISHTDFDLQGLSYVVDSEPTGNRYYNGTFITPTSRLAVETYSPVAGAARPDYNYGAVARYDVQEINGNTTNRGAQSFAFDDRTRSMFITEGGFISRYDMDGPVAIFQAEPSVDGSAVLGHQGLAVEYLKSGIKLWTTSIQGGRFAARFSYVAGTPITSAEVYELFTNVSFANSASCSPTVSFCGRYLVAHGIRFGTTRGVIRVFDIARLVNGGPGDYSSKWLYEFETQGLHDANNPVQGIACDGSTIFAVAGGTGFKAAVNKRLFTFTIDGQLIAKEENFRVGRTAAQSDGDGTRYEPEGLAILSGAGGQATLMAAFLSGQPGQRRFRIYGCGTSIPIVGRRLSLPGNVNSTVESVTISGREYAALRASGDLASGSGINLYGNNDSGNPGGIGEFCGSATRRVMSKNGNQLFKSDSGISPLTIDSVATGRVSEYTRSGSLVGGVYVATQILQIDAYEGGLISFGTAAAGTPVATSRWRVLNNGTFAPNLNNTTDIGDATRFVRNMYLTNAPIQTSNGDLKTPVRSLKDSELLAGAALADEIGIWQWLDKVATEGDSARLHCSLTVQRAIEVMESFGLDPMLYNFICHDIWPERTINHPDEYEQVKFTDPKTGEVFYVNGEQTVSAWDEVIPAGESFGFRDNGLTFFMLAGALHAKKVEQDKINARLDALESK